MDGEQSQCPQSKNSCGISIVNENLVLGNSSMNYGVPIDLESEEDNYIDVDIDVDDEHNDNSKEEPDSILLTAGKKRTSDVWLSFKVVTVGDIKKAECKLCEKHLSYNGRNGVSHLRKHANTSCPKRFLAKVGGQRTLRTITEADGTTILEMKEKYREFEQDYTRSKLVHMIVMHEYPLSMVDHFGFREYSKSLNPSFKLISRNTLRTDILKMYKGDKLSLRRLLESNDSRIAVTTDMWTSSQKKGYMVVTSHFIDQNWNLRNRTLRFCFVPCPHTNGVLAKVLMDCLSQYGLESKISSVVVDNCTTNDAMMRILLKNFEKKCLMLKGSFLHLRCSAHILNLIVKDGLDVIESGISMVRECVSFWMSTPKRIEKFEEACRFQGIDNNKRLILDCKTRWNSTFLMLESALPYVNVFERLKRLNEKLKFDIPSDNDWKLASIICKKLEIFSNATKVFSGRNYPTSNLFFRKACEIKLTLRCWLSDTDSVVRSMAEKMIEKFDKYWEHISGLLAIAAILDPRNKMDCVKYYFKILYNDESEKEVSIVRKYLDDLVVEYQQKSEENKIQEVSKENRKRIREVSSIIGEEDRFAKEKKNMRRKVNVMGEVDHYLEDDTEPENDNFDVLNWWKIDLRYPTLKKIAKDILAIPISSVASESAFSMGGRVVSPHRSRLHADTVEALMCLQNWKMQDIQGDMEGTSACSTVNEDSDLEGEAIDKIDMDVDDIPNEDMEEEDPKNASSSYY